MKLLIVTQVVDKGDSVLGFFHKWIEEFAKHAESVEVICLKKGEFSLPRNVKVYSLGKERGKRGKLVYSFRFLKLAWKLRDKRKLVFVHMNPEYLVIAGWLWRLMGNKIALWYMHKSIPRSLRLGIPFSHRVFTASPRSMRVPTQKKRVVGHGIPADEIEQLPPPSDNQPLNLLSVGRLSPVKQTHLLIEALATARSRGIDAHLTIIGGAAGDRDETYITELKQQVEHLQLEESVVFTGPLSKNRVRGWWPTTHLFMHASATGSLDKASLEPLAHGIPIITVDPELAESSVRAVLSAEENAESIASAIGRAYETRLWDDDEIRLEARDFVAEKHSLTRLIDRILAEMEFSIHRSEMDKEQLKEHFNRVAAGGEHPSYERRRWEANPKVQGQSEMTRQFIERYALPLASRADRITELGPGPGTWTRLLAEAAPEANFLLTDISHEMLERAKSAIPEVKEVQTLESEFLSAALPEWTADFFFSSRAIEYIEPKDAVADRIWRHLKQDGRGVMITKMPKRALNFLSGRKPSAIHRAQVKPSTLTRLMRKRGFTHVHVYPVTFSVPLLKSVTADKLASRIFSRLPLNPFSAFLTESYGVIFRKS